VAGFGLATCFGEEEDGGHRKISQRMKIIRAVLQMIWAASSLILLSLFSTASTRTAGARVS
jgi:hypothetical protein